MYQRLVVPLDGLELAERALVDAELLTVLTHAPIHLVRVIEFADQDTYAVYGMMGDPATVSYLLTDEAASASQYLESVVQCVAAQGHLVTSEVRHGSVADQLIAIAQPGDLYIMASHGRRGVARWFLGSVAEDVVRRSPVSVLLVKSLPWFHAVADQSVAGEIQKQVSPFLAPQR